MIAEFNEQGNLPHGIHTATWEEISERFGINYYRKQILRGLKSALDNLKSSGCTRVFLDESFTTLKNRPNDFDGCWDSKGVDLEKLDSVLQDFSNGRKAQKVKYNGEIFSLFLLILELCWIFFNKTKNPVILRESYQLIWRNYHDKK